MRNRKCNNFKKLIYCIVTIILIFNITLCQKKENYSLGNAFLKSIGSLDNESSIYRVSYSSEMVNSGTGYFASNFKKIDTLEKTDTVNWKREYSLLSEIGGILAERGNIRFPGWFFNLGIDIPFDRSWSIQLKYSGAISYLFTKSDEYGYGNELMILICSKFGIKKYFFRFAYGVGYYFAKPKGHLNFDRPFFQCLAVNFGYDISKQIDISFGIRRYIMFWGAPAGADFFGINLEWKF